MHTFGKEAVNPGRFEMPAGADGADHRVGWGRLLDFASLHRVQLPPSHSGGGCWRNLSYVRVYPWGG